MVTLATTVQRLQIVTRELSGKPSCPPAQLNSADERKMVDGGHATKVVGEVSVEAKLGQTP